MDVAYFDALYASADGDPWHFASSDYERQKYEATLAALPRRHYARALEIGCSIGVLTRMLAQRCGQLVATEPVDRALSLAQKRCGDLGNIRFERQQAPDEWPSGAFDLILLSEVLYYFNADRVAQFAARVTSSIAPDGQVLLVHWTGDTDYPLSGDQAVETFVAASTALKIARQERTNKYRLDLLERCEQDFDVTSGNAAL